MNYKYQRRQLFGKRLNVPKDILYKVYKCTLSFDEFIEYQLDDKIPISCIEINDRKIVEKFGIEKCKALDWELVNKRVNNNNDLIRIRDILMTIDSQTDDINQALYELVKDQIKPSEYSSKMSEVYSDRLFEIPPSENNEIYDYSESNPNNLKKNFNKGNVNLKKIIKNWELFKDKDLSYCLLNDDENENHISDSLLKDFMKNYGIIAPLMIESNNIYTVINTISNISSEEKKNIYLKQLTDEILSKTYRQHGGIETLIKPTDEQYKEIFKYSSVEEYLKIFNKYDTTEIMKELNSLPQDYIFNMPIPFSVLLNSDVISFIREYGLKNIVDFDNECGHFFTNNNCEMLKEMYDKYLYNYASMNVPDKTFFVKKDRDENGNYINRTYTKDEFYEAMRRMMLYGPSKFGYTDKLTNFRNITGEFRTRNKDLFISEQAPEELQNLFYSKSITPQFLFEHPEYIQYLNGKNLSSCLKKIEIHFDNNGTRSYENFYKFIGSKTDYNGVMNFITEYSDVLGIIFDEEIAYDSNYDIGFSTSDNIDEIQNKIHVVLRKIIIEKGVNYPKHIPENLIKKYPTMFLDKNAPQELQEAFYSRTISTEFILSNPSYIEYLKKVDLKFLFKFIPLLFRNEKDEYELVNLVDGVAQIFGTNDAFNILLLYWKYIEKIFKDNELRGFRFNPKFSKDDLLDEIDSVILQNIINGTMKYDESMHSHFQKSNPTLFLGKNVPKDIKDKFYNRKFTTKDFSDNPDLFDIFDKTNIACGFSESVSWIIPLFNDHDMKKANIKRLKIIDVYLRSNDDRFKEFFKDYIINQNNDINMDKIDIIEGLFSRLEYSNSIEISSFKYSLLNQLLKTEDPFYNLEKIEKVFLKNNLPLCGKMYLCFQILYPKLSEVLELDGSIRFNFSENSRIAPELKDDTLPNIGLNVSNDEKRLIIIFNDLLRVSYRSNERSLVDYLNNIEEGNKLYLELKNNNFDISVLNENEIQVLQIFVNHLETMYENTEKGKNSQRVIDSLPLKEKLIFLSDKFSETDKYDLKDRIVRSFCFIAGIKSFNELKSLMKDSLEEQKERTNRNLKELENNNGRLKLEEGDIVRGIGFIEALSGSINTGNFCKEQLGSFLGSSESDTTPLDVDLSIVTNTENIYSGIKNSPTGFGFGNLFVIIKKDNPNINITRDSQGNLTGAKYDPKKVEVFGTKTASRGFETHWGGRTGISLADVDYILYKERAHINDKEPYDKDGNVNYLPSENPNEKSTINELEAVKFEIAKNGYYIPVVDFTGKLVFDKAEFDKIRSKMQGLSYFGENNYELSDELINDEVLEIASTITEESSNDTKNKRNQINDIIGEVFDEEGLFVTDRLTGDLSNKTVEFIDTGSTGRNTNVPYDGDFDFYLRLDAEIMRNNNKLREFKTKIIETFKKYDFENYVETSNGDLRFKAVHLKDGNVVDVDLSFGVKTAKVKYSSDDCLKDRLSTIKKLYPDKYNYVVANIIMAKRFLKSEDVSAYKPDRTDKDQGGLGGIGIENWILQNGGSFIEACKSFEKAAIDETTGEIIPFEDFKNKYQIWDFGENHFSARNNNDYLYDNFVENNMNKIGYEKMVIAIKKYLESLELEQEDIKEIK